MFLHKLKPLCYGQTHNLTFQYTPGTPHSHQCGCIAGPVQTIDELTHAVVGGDMYETWNEKQVDVSRTGELTQLIYEFNSKALFIQLSRTNNVFLIYSV